jgi:hypothetical protein
MNEGGGEQAATRASARAQSSPNKAYWQGLKGGREADEFVMGQKLQGGDCLGLVAKEPLPSL